MLTIFDGREPGSAPFRIRVSFPGTSRKGYEVRGWKLADVHAAIDHHYNVDGHYKGRTSTRSDQRSGCPLCDHEAAQAIKDGLHRGRLDNA